VLVTVADARQTNNGTGSQSGTVVSYSAIVVSANDYSAFGAPMAGRTYSSPSYRYGFNGMEKVDEMHDNSGDSYDFGARIYDARIGRFLSCDPLMNQNHAWTPYHFGIDNPIMFIDSKGEWPGVTFIYTEFEGGAGVGYGLNYVIQRGVVYDEVGHTHIEMTSSVYIVNQNLEESSTNPQVVVGASISLTQNTSQNWGNETFYGILKDQQGGSAGVPYPIRQNRRIRLVRF
jgi:RHS repeat-associated protein